jgi:chemotaxis regulatin CheY-phosphate phosphatase CheZ
VVEVVLGPLVDGIIQITLLQEMVVLEQLILEELMQAAAVVEMEWKALQILVEAQALVVQVVEEMVEDVDQMVEMEQQTLVEVLVVQEFQDLLALALVEAVALEELLFVIQEVRWSNGTLGRNK